MRDFIVRAGLAVALVCVASGARAATQESTSECVAGTEVDACVTPPSREAGVTPEWIIAVLVRGNATAAQCAELSGAVDLPLASLLRSAKPNQNPAFPAAFVFQSHSASYLAVDLPRVSQSARIGKAYSPSPKLAVVSPS